MAVPAEVDFVELLLFAALLVPAGDALVRGWERLRGEPLPLTLLERALVAFYAMGGLLYVAAYAPLGLFTRGTLPILLLSLGTLGWLLTARQVLRGSSARRSGAERSWWERAARSPERLPWLAVLLLFLAVLCFEALVVGSQLAPNTYDGSVQTDYIAILLSQGHAAFTLAPFAPMGVVYPQGTAVWMGSAAALFGWPAFTAPVLLPPLFMALSVPAAYAAGRRILGADPDRGRRAGVIFAAGTALVLTWPRFLVAGSYDFLFTVPLFLLVLGWMLGPRRGGLLPWDEVLFLGLGLGVMAAMSPVAPEVLIASFVAIEVFRPTRRALARLGWAARAAALAGLAVLFEVPTFVGFLVWWSYPSHVLTPLGGLPAPVRVGPVDPWGTFVGLVDPFLFRPQDVWLSPFPLLKVEIALLFAGGLLVLVGRGSGFGWPALRAIPPRLVTKLAACLLATALLILFFTVGARSSSLVASLGEVSSSTEISILLFMVFGLVAMLPIVLAWEEIERAFARREPASPPTTISAPAVAGPGEPAPAAVKPTTGPRRARPSPLFPGGLPLLVALLVVAVPIATGTVETGISAPSYLLAETIGPLANVTPADLSALSWMGSNLPSCSGVLVSPGSAGEFLPSYNPSLRVIFPLVPRPVNLSYWRAVANLTAGNFTSTTGADLQALEVTEVLVTGQNNVLWKPFNLTAFVGSPEFKLVYPAPSTLPVGGGGGAYVFEFVPTVEAVHCAPTG